MRPKQKRPSINPQDVKHALLEAASRIGKRRRPMCAAELFELVISCAAK
jgi:hypothetical protein